MDRETIVTIVYIVLCAVSAAICAYLSARNARIAKERQESGEGDTFNPANDASWYWLLMWFSLLFGPLILIFLTANGAIWLGDKLLYKYVPQYRWFKDNTTTYY